MPRRARTREEDQRLVRAVVEGQPGAWEEFYSRYHKLMISCVRRVYRKHGVFLEEEELSDLLSQVCLNLVANDYHKLRVFDPDKGHKLSSWVGLISANTAYDALRRRAPVPHVSLDDPDSGVTDTPSHLPSPLDALEASERRALLRQAVARLTSSEREFVRLLYEELLDPVQVARRLGIRVNTVYSRKNKVKAKLVRIASEILAERSKGRRDQGAGSGDGVQEDS